MEKLNCKSLMIGDLVLYTEFGKNEFHKIEIVEPTRVWLKGCKTYVPDEFIEPIPLTPEILEKNGFVYKEEERGMLGILIAPHYMREDVPFEIFCDGEPFAIWFQDPVNIKYVHEIQHALRLCGITKDIEL